ACRPTARAAAARSSSSCAAAMAFGRRSADSASKTAAMLRLAVFPAKIANPRLGGGLRGHREAVTPFTEGRRHRDVGGLQEGWRDFSGGVSPLFVYWEGENPGFIGIGPVNREFTEFTGGGARIRERFGRKCRWAKGLTRSLPVDGCELPR